MNKPRITVIIPCYNREVLLCETLDSVLAQTFGDWEAIVIDDHSEDRSFEVAQRYSRLDGRIRATLRRSERKGGNNCRNEGLSLAQGEYVVFLDSDDLLGPTCLENRVADMDKSPNCGFGVYYTELFTRAVGDRKVLWNAFNDTKDLYRFLGNDPVWITSGPIWHKQVLQQVGGFNGRILSFQDWDLHVRALIHGVKYFKQPVRDNFHRFEHDPDNQVSGIAFRNADHLKTREELFVRTFQAVQTAGLLNEEIRCRLAGLFWLLAELWELQSNVPAAEAVWHRAMELGLCNRLHYLQGRLILQLHSRRRGQPVVRLIKRFWPPQFTKLGSEFLKRAPLGCAKPDTTSA